MQKNIFFYYAALISCIALVAVCFVPWVHYIPINETFSGFNVKKFATGVTYGRPGVWITIFSGIILLFTLWKNRGAKQANLFLSAVLFAYCIRSYILFTGSLFKDDVVKLPGIWLMLFFSFMIMLCALFPNLSKK